MFYSQSSQSVATVANSQGTSAQMFANQIVERMKAQTGEKAGSRVEAESKLQHKLQCVKEAFQLILSSSLPLFRPARPTASWMNANEMENGNLNGSAQMKRGETMQIYGSSSERIESSQASLSS